MSKKKKHKKNKKSHVGHGTQVSVAPKAEQSTNLNENEAEVKLLEGVEKMIEQDNEPTNTIDETINSSSKVEVGLDSGSENGTASDAVVVKKEELKETKEVTNERNTILHDGVSNSAPNNFIPLWIGIIVGAVLMYLFL